MEHAEIIKRHFDVFRLISFIKEKRLSSEKKQTVLIQIKNPYSFERIESYEQNAFEKEHIHVENHVCMNG